MKKLFAFKHPDNEVIVVSSEPLKPEIAERLKEDPDNWSDILKDEPWWFVFESYSGEFVGAYINRDRLAEIAWEDSRLISLFVFPLDSELLHEESFTVEERVRRLVEILKEYDVSIPLPLSFKGNKRLSHDERIQKLREALDAYGLKLEVIK